MNYDILIPVGTLVLGYLLHLLQTLITERQKFDREKREKRNSLLLEFLMKLNRYTNEVISGLSKMNSQRLERDYIQKLKERIDVVSGQFMAAKAITELYGNHKLNTLVEELNDLTFAAVDEFLKKEKECVYMDKFSDLIISIDFFKKKKEVLEALKETMGIKLETK